MQASAWLAVHASQLKRPVNTMSVGHVPTTFSDAVPHSDVCDEWRRSRLQMQQSSQSRSAAVVVRFLPDSTLMCLESCRHRRSLFMLLDCGVPSFIEAECLTAFVRQQQFRISGLFVCLFVRVLASICGRLSDFRWGFFWG